jgi:hypothetical protein
VLTDFQRRVRREEMRRRARRRRQAAVGALVAAAVLFAVTISGIAGGGGDGAAEADSVPVAATPTPPPAPPELPTGGRRIFPDYRVVAYYGAPQHVELGALGIGRPDQAVRKLRRQARHYETKRRPVLLALELISTIATGAPGDDGKYRMHQKDRVIDRYLRAARRAEALLILDIQPGHDDFYSEVVRLRKWLKEPEVGVALDPEWRMPNGGVPGQSIGTVTAREVNATSAYVADIVERHDLPEKLFLVHQFTDGMIQNKHRIKPRDGLAITFNVDGFGTPEQKLDKWNIFTKQQPRLHDGYKLFYKEDTNVMSPRDVMRMRPRPDLIVYE